MERIAELARAQLSAYNAADLEGFVSCYHPSVEVREGEQLICEGRAAFRERYRALFEGCEFGGEVPERVAAGGHCVDLELWWRVAPKTGERSEGRLLVHYTLRDELIGSVRFLR